MSYTIKKRDGRPVPFDSEKIKKAVLAAFLDVDGEITDYAKQKAQNIADYISGWMDGAPEDTSIEDIQDLVEKGLMSCKRKDVGKSYILFRQKRDIGRRNPIDVELEDMLGYKSEHWKRENSNKNAKLLTTQRDYMAGIVSNSYTRRYLLDEDLTEAHDEGLIHFHDMDYFAQNAITNCCLVNLKDMLMNGTVINNEMIESPHQFLTAMNIATQIILGVSSSQSGGTTVSMTHLAPFVRRSFYRYYIEGLYYFFGEGTGKVATYKYSDADHFSIFNKDIYTNSVVYKYAWNKTMKEIEDGVQTFNYQVNSMTNTNGQSPFLSVALYINEDEEYTPEIALITEEFLYQRIKGIKNKDGVYTTQAFPKLLYFTDDNNITEDSDYYYLTELAVLCNTKRMAPDFISAEIMRRDKGDVYACMGCRSFLTPDVDGYGENGEHKYYGRFNVNVSTLNLPYVALLAIEEQKKTGGDLKDIFWKKLEYGMSLVHRTQQIRYKRLSKVTSDIAPILWQHGALARLKPGESIEPLLRNNYSTSSIGYAGLYECVLAITGETHSKERTEGYEFGMAIMNYMNDSCLKWREEEKISYSLYGTPIESTTLKFAKAIKKFPIIKGVNDKNYITNSYHITPAEVIDPFEKLRIEGQYQKLSPGGAISYIEMGDMINNPEAVMQVVQYMYHNTMYAEMNIKSDYCYSCGYEGEIELTTTNDGKFGWKCPCCGETDEDNMAVTRRVCGYLGTNGFNQGRMGDIHDRYVHLK